MEAPDAARSSPPPRSPATGLDIPARLTDAISGPPADTALFALARFEFEADKGNEGTKILMVEWDPSASPTAFSPSSVSLVSSSKAWKVSWEGKANYLPASDNVIGTNKRVYFLLPPGAAIPPIVTIAHPDGTVLITKPLPAIFPPGLVAGSSDVGARGILHTIWAKKRLSELEEEIEVEMKANAESVGLEMALQERQWIVAHFGVAPKNDARENTTAGASQTLRNPVSPKPTPGGRLGEKLKGLKLVTSAADLIAGSAGMTPVGGCFVPVHTTHADSWFADKDAHLHTISFSPASNDTAVSSFSNFARQTIPGSPQPGESVSLDAVLNNSSFPSKRQDQEQEEDLFALPMSPRSPEMKRSPFSLG
ncbi:hypothetical protein CH63R_01126 [Colletotrichum higginsianum IMI 349063]|uniref:Uncharacterized protein n=1 Tax=Colletotrichum higginsianum (strain IMI 349063) TaxID=759273 RepID=A0A1B7YV70_COLHI|nr:hypothetical protein CH63R_01126 [Colletotrichum higginsianum IMI 349063]OBR15946.1 hypothetical protein CH63R_01126 [Colletotrichum higginsianum IMI 349063]GJC91793.1 hypothetical protein ColKHC_00619 [Colletotrichum higginsianum]